MTYSAIDLPLLVVASAGGVQSQTFMPFVLFAVPVVLVLLLLLVLGRQRRRKRGEHD